MDVINYFIDAVFPPKDYCYICETDADSVICASCRSVANRFEGTIVSDISPMSEAYAALYYDEYSRKLIFDLKFNSKPYLAKAMAYFLDETVKNIDIRGVDFITYVPLYVSKEKRRGYNQSALLAEELGNRVGLPVISALKKVKDNKIQHELGRDARQENVKGAYEPVYSGIDGRTILLIDDVWTSGSTMRECAKTLRSAGAKRIIGLCFAKRFE